MIKIYNTLTKQKEEFLPLKPPHVNMYTCGVTVYDDCHIGHARSLYIFDVIRRYLQYRGFDIKLVRNITDVDDKIINRAKESNTDPKELVDKYIAAYYRDMAALGVSRADVEPRATENIPEMIKYIQGLIDKGFAYTTATGVYFSVRKFPGYGKLSGQSVDQMLEGVRKTGDETKNDPLDFALWKAAKTEEPFWESPWGRGRPGWHIECSVMSQKYLGVETLDIHAGGRDLVFPHHENEIAQTEALTGKPFAKYWIHHGLLTINQQKMSKSLGNFVTIQNAIKDHHPDALKIFYLKANYSSSVDFSDKAMMEARKDYRSMALLVDNIKEIAQKAAPQENPDLKKTFNAFISAMDDDFHTPVALSHLRRLIGDTNTLKQPSQTAYGYSLIKEALDIFGLSPETADLSRDRRLATEESKGFKEAFLQDGRVNELIKERIRLKKEKRYTQADEIRKMLENQGIEVLDKEDGTTAWRLK